MRCIGVPIFSFGHTLTSLCDYLDLMFFDAFQDFLLVLMIVQGIFMLFEVFHFFKLIIVTNAIFFAKPSGRMFLRFIDHRIQLYPMVVNNWSSDAMFAIYHPSRYTTIKFRQRGKSFYKGCPTIPILQRRFGHCEKAVRLVKCGIPKH